MSRRGWAALAAVLSLLLCAGLALCFAGPMAELLGRITAWLVETVGRMGYPGVVALMFLESSFFPFPSEVVMPASVAKMARTSTILPKAPSTAFWPTRGMNRELMRPGELRRN